VPTEIIFVRHGETDWNRIGRIQGVGGPGLNETGLTQARTAANALCTDHLAAKPIHAIYASDLDRAYETAEIIAEALGIPFKTDSRLRERHHGTWQGYTVAQLNDEFPDWRGIWRSSPLDGKAPGGESVREMIARVAPLLDEIAERHPNQRVVLISHGGVIGVFRTLAASLPHDQVWTVRTDNCEIVPLIWPPKVAPDQWVAGDWIEEQE
jgi:2,3-bisphosphoglycerate-dependent phosphoglycerate mutase